MSRMASRAAQLLTPLPAPGVASVVQATDSAMAFEPSAVVTLADAPASALQAAALDRNSEAAEPAPIEAAPSSTTQDASVAAASDVKSTANAAVAMPAGAQARAATPPLATRQVTTTQVGAPSPLPHSPANAGSIGGALFSLVLVIALILGLAWLAKRMPGFRGAAGNSALRVVGSLALGPRERVVVVAVGDTQLVLGVGTGGTRTLHTLTEPLPVVDAKASPAFAQLLAQHFGKKA